eukprot:2593527-Rhodomonas_salina.2
MEKGGLKVRSRKDLTADELTRVYGSRFHCKIKRHTSGEKQGKVKRCKVCLIVQGNKMEKGYTFFDSFSSTPRAAAMQCIVSTAAAADMHLHTVDFEQAFIQGDWSSLPEGAPTCFIKPPSGWDGADTLGLDAVLELCSPLYGHPAAAHCLFFTLNDFMTDLGFEKAGFNESMWVQKAGCRFKNKIVVGVHIDDSMIL